MLPRARFYRGTYALFDAAQQLDVSLSDICMVAAHDWDIAGAQAAGCATAFIARPGMVLGPLQQRPDMIGPDLASVTDQILAP